MPQEEHPLGVRHAEFLRDDFARQDVAVAVHVLADSPRFAVATQTGSPDLERAQRLLQRLLECATDGHRLADRFHLRVQRRVGGGEFLEREPRHLDDDVVDSRLEAGRRLAGDVVANLLEQITDCELGRELGNREAGRLRGQRRRARHARVHLDDRQPAVVRVDRELDVRAAGLDADLADHRERRVAHDLVLLVGERLRRGHGDRVAGVHAHWVEVFDRADDHAVVGPVTHDLHLEFLPANQRLLDEHLGDRRQVEAVLDHFLELVPIVRDAAAGAAERVGRPDDEREFPDVPGDLQRLLERVRHAAGRHVEANPDHGVLEKLAVLTALDRLGVGPDHLDVQALEHTAAVQRHCGV